MRDKTKRGNLPSLLSPVASLRLKGGIRAPQVARARARIVAAPGRTRCAGFRPSLAPGTAEAVGAGHGTGTRRYAGAAERHTSARNIVVRYNEVGDRHGTPGRGNGRRRHASEGGWSMTFGAYLHEQRV